MEDCGMNEAQTRKDLIDPAIEKAGWTKANGCQVLVEQSACEFAPGRVGKVRDKPLKADYILTYRGRRLVVVEAKSDECQAIEGCEQAQLREFLLPLLMNGQAKMEG